MAEEPKWTAFKNFLTSLLGSSLTAQAELLVDELTTGLDDINKGLIPQKGIVEKVVQLWTSPGAMTQSYSYKNLDRFYYLNVVRRQPPSSFPSTVEYDYQQEIGDYWDDTGYTHPGGYVYTVHTYGRASLAYPFLSAYTKLPDLTGLPRNMAIHFGFEHGGATKTGIASFMWSVQQNIPNRLYVEYGSAAAPDWLYMEVTSQLPANFLTAVHTYIVKLNKFGAEWFIDDKLVAVALDIPNALRGTVAAPPPYAVGIINTPIVKHNHPNIEIIYPYTSLPITGSLTFPCSPYWFRWSEGVPIPPRVYRLYDAGTETLFTSLTIAAGSETSHPFPIFGYEGKTVHFYSSQAGTLDIEILDQGGNWRIWNAVAVLANTPSITNITVEGVLARVTFTPTLFPCTIGTAEVVLR